MAYGKIKADTLTWDNGGTDTDISISTIPDAAALAAKADLASPTLTGTPTAPTATQGTNTTQLATTEYVQSEIGVSIQAYDAGLEYLNGLNFTDEASFKTTVNLEIGTDVQGYDVATAKTDTAQIFTAGQRGAIISLTGASPTPNFASSNNFKITTSGTTTVGTPTNIGAGQTGSIFIVYGGADAISFPSAFKFVGGAAGVTPTSTASAIDRLDYIVLDDTSGSEVITVNFTANYVA